MTKRKPLIGADGEVRELEKDDIAVARRGRPPLPKGEKKKRVNLMLDPDVIERLRARGNMSAEANAILRERLGL